MDTTKYDLIFLLVVFITLVIGITVMDRAKQKASHTFELIHEINGHIYVMDTGLTEGDCVVRLQPHTRNYCQGE